MSGSPTGVNTEPNTDNIHNEGMSKEDAYKLGVREVSREDPTIFIDPDSIRTRRFGPPGKQIGPAPTQVAGISLRRQLDGQAEGATDALHVKYNEDETTPKTVGQMARSLKEHGPAAMPDLKINGVDHGLAIVPDRGFDSKKEVVYGFTEHFDRSTRREILENMPGTDNDWMRLIGNHEGAHAAGHGENETYLETLIEETRADRITREKLLERGQDDIALAFKDLRALAGRVDPTHSSAPLTNSTDPVTDMHLEIAWKFREETDDAVDDNFDWDSYEGKAEDAKELLKENPEAYFAAAQKSLDELEAKVMADYQAEPNSLDNQRAVVEAQIMIGYQKNFEDAYRRRVIGENVPERAPIQLITQDQEDAYMANKDLHERITKVESNMSLPLYSGEFSSDELFENYDWSSYPGEIEDEYDLSSLQRYELKMELLQAKQEEVMTDYRENPSLDTLERALHLQKALNDTAEDVNNYRSHEDDPNRIEPITLVSDIEKQEVLIAHIKEEDRLQAIENEIGEVRHDHYLEARDAYIEKVQSTFDWESYEGEATDLAEVYDESPDVACWHELNTLETMKQEALAAYNADPSYENTGKLLEVQHLVEDRYDAINIAIESGEVSEAIPRQEIPTLVPEEAEVAYYRERKQKLEEAENAPEAEANTEAPENDTPAETEELSQTAPEEDKGYAQGPDGSAYTTEVASVSGGEPNVDFQNGISVAGMSMSSFFGHNVNPDPNDVKVVSAIAPEAEQTIDPAILQPRENTQSMQTLG